MQGSTSDADNTVQFGYVSDSYYGSVPTWGNYYTNTPYEDSLVYSASSLDFSGSRKSHLIVIHIAKTLTWKSVITEPSPNTTPQGYPFLMQGHHSQRATAADTAFPTTIMIQSESATPRQLRHHTASSLASTSSNTPYTSFRTHDPPPPPPHPNYHHHHTPVPRSTTPPAPPPTRHEWTETCNTTIAGIIEHLVVEIPERGSKRFFCGWTGCRHAAGFVRKVQLLTHIRSVHFCEKPFVCMTCDASFTRRQDAIRHADTMNSGKQYKCNYCEEGFARKDYRDRHVERCNAFKAYLAMSMGSQTS